MKKREYKKCKIGILFISLIFLLCFIIDKNVYAQMVDDSDIATVSAVKKIRVKLNKNNFIKLSWEEVEDAKCYQVYRSTKPKKGFKKIREVTKTSYVDQDVLSGKVYYYKIAIVDKKTGKKGLLSSAYPAYMKPDAPMIAGYYTEGKNKLIWKKVRGAETYLIYRKNKKGKYKKIGETERLHFYDSKIKKGRYYTYKVIASYKKNKKVVSSKDKIFQVFSVPIDPNKKMVALTFDDGPGRYTKEIVECLEQHHAKATFFIVGCNIDGYEDTILKAHKIGCEIGNHSYDHSHFTRISETEIKRQISATDKKIKDIIGMNALYLRTPGGLSNKMVEGVVNKPIILWSIDTRDWETQSKTSTIRSVVNHVQDGDIVLMHDIYKPTKDAAIYLIDELQREGYQLVTVSELAMHRGYELKRGNKYFSFKRKK